MEEKNNSHSVSEVLKAVGWPVFWGTALFVAFLVGIRNGVINNSMITRYATAHEISYVVTCMFFIGLVASWMKIWDVMSQISTLDKIKLDRKIASSDSTPSDECARLHIDNLNKYPADTQASHLWTRLHDVLSAIQRGGVSVSVEDELKYSADVASVRQQDGFALIRILIWAIPMLGFLGTVIGISEALGGISVGPDNNFESMMGGLRSSLYVAFDTTALALTLSIVLMFGQFIIDRFETQLFDNVESRAAEELSGLFVENQIEKDQYLAAVKKMSQMVLKSIEQINENQTKLWRESIGSALGVWNTTFAESTKTASESLAESVDETLGEFSEKIQNTLADSDQRVARRWEQWQVALSENARIMQRQQEDLVRQASLLENTINSTTDVVKLQDSLNQNMNSLKNVGNFEETILTLSAAVNMLSAKATSDQSQTEKAA